MSQFKVYSKMGMNTSVLQEKITYLQEMADSLLRIGEIDGDVYTDNLSLLNQQIHEGINELFPLKGTTDEQEAALCLALLMGYSVSMYANSEDDVKRKIILDRSRIILKKLSPTSLRFQLSTICNQF